MRIIGGECRGRRLNPLKAKGIRPTPDRVREAVFSSLLSRFGSFTGLSVLDLFAGTGALSLEALSRGAESATMVDISRDAESTIKTNAETCRLKEKVSFFSGDVRRILPTIAKRSDRFDLICLDPPIDWDWPILHLSFWPIQTCWQRMVLSMSRRRKKQRCLRVSAG